MQSLDSTLANFVRHGLILSKDAKYKLAVLPLVQDSSIHYTIIVHCADCSKINEQLEDIVADLGALIKKHEQDFVLDWNNLVISDTDKLLLTELLAINLYAFTKYKKDKEVKYGLSILSDTLDTKKFTALLESMKLTRDLVNDPAHSTHPEQVEAQLRDLFSSEQNISITVIKGKDLQEKGMNGIYEVGKGSNHAPRLVLVEYKGRMWDDYDYALVGKGVCFDAGGYNIKPTGGIEDMKTDMTGAATVIGLLHYMVSKKLQKNCIIALPIVENLISGDAYKPGDVITMYNGKTVEVGNTDAEGRLILADTLSYVEEIYKPSYVFDFATLTGAQVVALGTRFAALLWRNHNLNKKIQEKSLELKDRVRELPFYEPYFKAYKSDIADMNNIHSRSSGTPGTVGAALFLSQFISMENWVHIDIAGPSSIAHDPISGGGATACMIRLMIYWLEHN